MVQRGRLAAMIAVPIRYKKEVSAPGMVLSKHGRLAAMMDAPVMHGNEVSA